MAVTCDRLVERGVRSDADRFRVATLRQRVESAERQVAENGARWSAAFDAMAAQLEDGFVSRRSVRGASVDWLGSFSPRRRRPPPAGKRVARMDCDAL